MNVSRAISLAFLLAQQKHSEISGQWVKISAIVGGALPKSDLMVHIQRDGKIDVLIRSLEDEFDPNDTDDLFQLHHLGLLTTYWVGSVYEVFRLLRGRKLIEEIGLFQQIFRSLELVRMPLDKHEIAKDWILEEPLEMVRLPRRDEESDRYSYDPKDNKRGHIMPSGISARGSIMWHAIDVKSKTSFWIERRTLSDQIISLWGSKNLPSC